MNGTQCDTCRVFTSDPQAGGWLFLAQFNPAGQSPFAAMLGGGGGPELAGTFCSLLCLAEYAYARLAAEGITPSGERLPGTGTEGWIG